MENTSLGKGNALESAVKLIIEAGLEADPKVKGNKFTIETKVRDTSSGVLHEIDVLVKTLPNSEYEAKFIFECKNWEAPVDKNEVLILAKKVDALRANRGFLVAKSLSEYARRQIDLEPRVTYIRCSNDFMMPFISMELLHTDQQVLPPTISLTWRAPTDSSPTKLDPHSVICLLNGRPTNFLRFIDAQLDKIVAETRKKHHVQLSKEGTHWIQTNEEIHFSENELVIDGLDVAIIVIPFRSFVKCQRRKIISKFELEGRGQVFTFEPIDIGDPQGPLEIQMVRRFKET